MNLKEFEWRWGLGFGWLRIGTIHRLYNPNYCIFLNSKAPVVFGRGECCIKLSCSYGPKLHQHDLQSH
jgi:hypothetical protein